MPPASCEQPDHAEYDHDPKLDLSIAQSCVKSSATKSAVGQSCWRRVDLQARATEDSADVGTSIAVGAGGNRSAAYQVTKRLMDIIGASCLLVICSPLLIVTCMVLIVTTRGRPLFRQTRYGLHGKPFTLYKLRTMVTNADELRHLAQLDGLVFKKRDCRDPRVTRFGALLRKTSIDELPQLINVLLGQMSLVGPRPLSADVDRFQTWQLDRFSVRPGLTCLWQVSGRSDIEFEEWMHMDLWYVEHQCLWTDAVLLLRTPATVLSCRGAG